MTHTPERSLATLQVSGPPLFEGVPAEATEALHEILGLMRVQMAVAWSGRCCLALCAMSTAVIGAHGWLRTV